ncbi:hypothetical protein C8C85_3022 [Flavobacterium sp. 103]|nr:hypothetical protein C8C85_3022 [Flavobacterium sp. 103]
MPQWVVGIGEFISGLPKLFKVILVQTIINFGAERLRILAGIGPAIRFNLFIFKGKIKRIFTAIGAKGQCD